MTDTTHKLALAMEIVMEKAKRIHVDDAEFVDSLPRLAGGPALLLAVMISRSTPDELAALLDAVKEET